MREHTTVIIVMPVYPVTMWLVKESSRIFGNGLIKARNDNAFKTDLKSN